MRRHRLALPLAAVAVAAAALPAGASAATWAPAHDATSAGRSVAPAVAANTDGRFAIGFVRELAGDHRAEVRTGRLTDRLRRGSVLLDAARSNVDSMAVGFVGENGPLAAAWRRAEDRAQRLRGAIVGEDGVATSPFGLTADGRESAYEPRFVAPAGGTPLLVWDRRTTSAQAPVEGFRFGVQSRVPGMGVAAQPSVAVLPGGAELAVWVQGGRVMTAVAAGVGQPFGAPTVLSGSGTARDPRLATTEDGTGLVGWVRNGGAGNVMEVAARVPGGAFGTPTAISSPDEGAFAPELAPSGSGFLAVWVAGPTGRGWGSASGPIRALRLGADGAPSGTVLTLTPAGDRVVDPSVATDGRGGVVAGWRIGTGAARRIVARRIAGNGVVGAPRTLDAGSRIEAGAPVMAGAQGAVAAAWTSGGVIRYRLYR